MRSSRWHFRACLLATIALLGGCDSGPQTPPESVPSATPTPREIRAKDPLADAYFRRGTRKLDGGLPAEALEEANAALALDPEFGDAHLLRGRATFALGRYGDAVKSFEAALDLVGRDPDILYLMAEAYRLPGRWKGAEAAYLEVLELDPQNAEARKRLALFYVTADRLDEALETVRIAQKQLPDQSDLLVQEAIILRQRGDSAAALEILAKARRTDPTDPRASYEHGLTLKHNGQNIEAEAAFLATLAIQPVHEGSQYQLAQIARLKGDSEGAKRHLELYEVAHKFAEEERVLKATILSRPGSSEIHFKLGILQAKHGYLAKAEKNFEQVVLLDRLNRQASTNLGRVRVRLGRPDSAFSPLRRAIDLEPDVAQRWLDLAEAQHANGAADDALESIRTASAKAGALDADTLTAVALAFERHEKWEEAMALYQQAVQAAPENGEGYAGRGLIRTRFGQDADAINDLEAALAYGTTRATVVRSILNRLRAPTGSGE